MQSARRRPASTSRCAVASFPCAHQRHVTGPAKSASLIAAVQVYCACIVCKSGPPSSRPRQVVTRLSHVLADQKDRTYCKSLNSIRAYHHISGCTTMSRSLTVSSQAKGPSQVLVKLQGEGSHAGVRSFIRTGTRRGTIHVAQKAPQNQDGRLERVPSPLEAPPDRGSRLVCHHKDAAGRVFVQGGLK